MKTIFKLAIATAIASTGAIAPAANAQVSGIATADPTVAIARTKAFSAAYSQVATTYKTYFEQIDTRNKTMQGLQKQLDTNNDNQVSQQELDAAQRSNSPVIKSIQTEQEEIRKLQTPAMKAQMFAVEKILEKYGTAQQQVITAKKIGVILNPDAFQYAPPAADVTQDITNALDRVVPSVSTQAPAEWNPSRQTVALHQQLQQLIVQSAQAQARQQQTQQPAPAAAQPSGR